MFIEILHSRHVVGTEITILSNKGTILYIGFTIWDRGWGIREGINLKRAGGRWKSAEYELTWERSNISIQQNTEVMSYTALNQIPEKMFSLERNSTAKKKCYVVSRPEGHTFSKTGQYIANKRINICKYWSNAF